MKKFVAVAALAFSSLVVVNAKTYDITLSNPAKAGSVQLKPGIYKLKVEGSSAVFTDGKSKSYTTPVKVETGEKKYDDTRVHSTREGAEDRINQIDLGGSKTKLGF